tara:strand:+ start:3077 stop:3283 length:207 start_codon:yes stop_codon:yes gene_type:complete
MTYVLWLFFFLIILFFSGVFVWTLRGEQEEENGKVSELEEWNCPSCGFTVQLGTECIYCGEKKPKKGV